MKTHRILLLSIAAALLSGPSAWADNMASIGITPATGVVTLIPRWSLGPNLGGFHQMAQDLSLGGGANQFYSIKSTAIPLGGDVAAFTLYIAGSGAATNHVDIGSKLTPNFYSALTSADPDVGYGSVNFYLIHHKATGDYFSVIVPGSDTSSAIFDLKPMSGPGGPATLGASGYFGLTFAAANLGYGLNKFYYLRTDSVTGYTRFGTLDPALLASSADQFDLGMGGFKALAFTGTDVGYGTNKMYYLRLDPVTGFTILGTLHPVTGRAADIANLGSVYTALTFVPGDVGYGSGRFYTTGSVNPTAQTVSFAAIADRAISAGSFTVNPTASSALPITLTVVTGSATISSPVGGVFTVTPTAAGAITLQATQPGQVSSTTYESNMLRQSFTVTGIAGPVVDFNIDGKEDIVLQNTTTGERKVWLMNGTAFASEATVITTSINWRIVAAADFDSDGQADLLWENTSTGDRALFLMNGTTVASAIFLGNVSTNWSMVAAADFNHDGKPDILWQNTVTGDRALYLMNTLALSTATSLYLGNVSANWSMVAAADFNSDGRTDIVWQNTVTGDRAIFLLAGTTFAGVNSIYLGNFSTNWSIVAARDFNRDGSPDMLWQNASTGDRAIFLMNGTAVTTAVYLGAVTTDWGMR